MLNYDDVKEKEINGREWRVFRGMTAILSRMLREEYSAKVIYQLKPEGTGGNLP